MSIKTYSELLTLETFEERYNYLKCPGTEIGAETFGCNRHLNQTFYASPEWRHFRNKIIVRDCGCEMALAEYYIGGEIYIHHINPLTIDDLVNRSSRLMDPENVVCVSFRLHNDIHYGTNRNLEPFIDRTLHDTCPWKKEVIR